MKKKRSTRSANRRRNHFVDFLTVIICLAGIAGALYWFQNLIYKSLANESDTPVGIITFKKKSPRRRLEHENVWEYLKLRSTIYKGDYILTEDLSEAQLIFKDDNYIVDDEEGNVSRVIYDSEELQQIKTGAAEIHPNSMMRVGEDYLLHFISGSVSLSSGPRQEKLAIQIGEDIYVLNKNTTALFSLSSRISDDGMSTATVYCSSGEVKQTKAQAAEAVPTIIGAGQTYTAQVKPEAVEVKADDSVIPKSVKTIAANVAQKVTGKAPKEKPVVTQSSNAPFQVLVPPQAYSSQSYFLFHYHE